MAFLVFPIYFCDDDYEEKENLKVKVEMTEGVISINTQQITSYNEMDNKNTSVRMANGDCFECPLGIDEFEGILCEVESIFDLSKVTKN